VELDHLKPQEGGESADKARNFSWHGDQRQVEEVENLRGRAGPSTGEGEEGKKQNAVVPFKPSMRGKKKGW